MFNLLFYQSRIAMGNNSLKEQSANCEVKISVYEKFNDISLYNIIS